MLRTAHVIVPAMAFAVSLLGQSTLSGPSLGFVFDSDAKGIRPILGIPGAATLGKPMDLGTPIVKAAVSAQQDYVLAFPSSQSVLLVRIDHGTISTDTNVDISAVPDVIAISPAGSAAALFYRQTAKIQVLTGLPKSITPGQNIDISGLPNSLDTLAITDDGQSVLAGFPENTTPGSQSGEVYLIRPDGSVPRSILTVAHASSLTVIKNSSNDNTRDLLVADDAQNSLYKIADVAGGAVVTQVFGPDANIAGPFAVQTSLDNAKYVVVAQSGTVVILDVNGGDPVTLKCSCTPTGLHRLNGPGSFQLTETTDGILWMLDWDPTNAVGPRFLFVPPAPSDSAEQQQ
ncbi:MAG: hypothetical protein M3Y27_01785 [Acidobacteriota bacterium]|nr:hypothetical protein [Acidobacteriota bacterium]